MKIQIEKLDHFGRGITHLNGKICFIENALPEETLEIKIQKEHKNYILADTKKIIKESNSRINPICSYANICGGCQLAHLSFDEENKYKTVKVKEIMSKYANISPSKIKDIVSDSPYFYRNKITLHCHKKEMGLYKKKTNELIKIDKCLLLEKELNLKLPEVREKLLPETKKVTLRIGNNTKEIMTSIDNKTFPISITSKIGSKTYVISNTSFFQVNKEITYKLYEEIKDSIIKYHSKNVLDLYCGVGTISIYISDVVESVLGIESCSSAIEDAIKNKKLNTSSNTNFLLGKVEDQKEEITTKYDTIIVDPPRSGLDKKVINKILEIKPNLIIYVSCDPMTLARDLNDLKTTYKIDEIKPYNMFPRTYHVECITVLHR